MLIKFILGFILIFSYVYIKITNRLICSNEKNVASHGPDLFHLENLINLTTDQRKRGKMDTMNIYLNMWLYNMGRHLKSLSAKAKNNMRFLYKP